MDMSPLQRAREQRGLSQQAVADLIRNVIGPARGYSNLGIDANAVSRHERGSIAMPRTPYPELYARLYGLPVETLWPATIDGMDRRRFLRTVAAAGGGVLLSGDDDDVAAMLAVTSGFRRLEPTTPTPELREAVLGHLRFVGHRAPLGPRYAAAAAEVARFSAWLAWDQEDHQQARALYRKAAHYAERSGSEVVTAYMRGSWALWAAETGQRAEALRIGRRVGPARPIAAWLATMGATVNAARGDPDDTLAALREAERALKVEQEPSYPGIYPFTAEKLQAYTGRCYVWLGLNKAAIPALQEALRGMPPTKMRAVLLLDLAQALGDGDEARGLLAEAHQIGEQQRSRRILSRV